jgi:HD domain
MPTVAGLRVRSVSMQDLVATSKALAAELLPPLGDRWRHTQAVGSRAEEVSVGLSNADRDDLTAAAWLHDIGYAPQLVDTGFHPIDGAAYIARAGLPARIVALIAHHSCARFEAEVRGLSAGLEPYPLEDSPVMDALVYADMTTGPQGQPLTFDDRIAEILTRYAPDTCVHQAITKARSTLAEHVSRATARLVAGQPTCAASPTSHTRP